MTRITIPTTSLMAGLLAFGLVLSDGARAQNLNRMAATSVDPTTGGGQLVFVDADTMVPTVFPLPAGYRPANLIAMDRNGDVWLDDVDSYDLRKFSGQTGGLLAHVQPGRRASYMVTDQAASLIVATWDTTPSLQPGVYLEMYDLAGQLVRFLDLRTLFPPGVFVPRHIVSTVPTTFGWGIPRILVGRSGSLWLIVTKAAYDPVIRLNPNWTLHSSYGLHFPCSLLPDSEEGAWIACINNLQGTMGPIMPGAPAYGWVHLSSGGVILESAQEGGGLGANVPSYGQARSDGVHYQYPNAGGTVGFGNLWVHNPTSASTVWYPWAETIPVGTAVTSGFHLDGNARLWLIRNTHGAAGRPQSYLQRVETNASAASPSITSNIRVWIGDTPRHLPQLSNHYWYWVSFWGHATLHEYAMYTDPYGDLDQDGLANGLELANFTNPFVPSGSGIQMVATGGNPGTQLSVSYTVAGDAGLPYVAPFAIGTTPTPVAPGITVPFSLQDPLLALTVGPPQAWFGNTLGLLDSQGSTVVTLQIPNIPALSGFQFHAGIVTADPAGASLLKTVSPAYPITIP